MSAERRHEHSYNLGGACRALKSRHLLRFDREMETGCRQAAGSAASLGDVREFTVTGKVGGHPPCAAPPLLLPVGDLISIA